MNVGVSALVANQQALTTTGHNIANVNSAGYSRQTVATKALVGQNMGTGFVGKADDPGFSVAWKRSQREHM